MGEWISVKEQLPPDRKSVLGWAPKHLNIFAVELKDGIWCEWYTGSTREFPEDTYSPITHWREMPERPNEDDDNVNHPAHYNMGGIEVINAINAWGFGDGFNRGNAIKYIARAGRKDPAKEVEDLKKARFYIDAEIKRLGEKEDNE
jgi:hypothetical protein